jgi:hypothetical protein
MKYIVTDEKVVPEYGCWSREIEADDPEDAAFIGAERAWNDWAYEQKPPFWLYVNGTKYEIDDEFEPIFSARKVK